METNRKTTITKRTKMNSDKTYYTVAEVATQLGVHTNTIHNWIKAGRLTPHRIGTRIIRITADQIKAAMEQEQTNEQ
jgi:excisionase family DNA binding protein